MDALEGLGPQRIDFAVAVARLEEVVRRPIGRPSEWEWARRVAMALDDLVTLGRMQIGAVLVEGGPLDDAVRSSPRLSGPVDRLRLGLPAIEAEAEALHDRLADLEPAEVRRRLIPLLHQAVCLRHGVNDTLWEAYNVDLGGQG